MLSRTYCTDSIFVYASNIVTMWSLTRVHLRDEQDEDYSISSVCVASHNCYLLIRRGPLKLADRTSLVSAVEHARRKGRHTSVSSHFRHASFDSS